MRASKEPIAPSEGLDFIFDTSCSTLTSGSSTILQTGICQPHPNIMLTILMRSKRRKGMIGIAVVGYGYWGPNIVRNFQETEGAQVLVCCDLDEQRLARVKQKYPSIRVT